MVGQCSVRIDKKQAKKRLQCRRKLKDLINLKTGLPYSKSTIQYLQRCLETGGVYIRELKATIKVLRAVGSVGSGPRTDFEKAVGILFKLCKENEAKAIATGDGAKEAAGRQVRELIVLARKLDARLEMAQAEVSRLKADQEKLEATCGGQRRKPTRSQRVIPEKWHVVMGGATPTTIQSGSLSPP
jgi:hypothetical protein